MGRGNADRHPRAHHSHRRHGPSQHVHCEQGETGKELRELSSVK